MDGEQGSVAALRTPADPANIPHDVESRGRLARRLDVGATRVSTSKRVAHCTFAGHRRGEPYARPEDVVKEPAS
jgi:hypothetical protein